MHRIDTPTTAVDKFGPGKHGFKDGNKTSGIAPTQFNAAWADSVQEEIANVIELVMPLNAGDNTQLRQAIQSMLAGLPGAGGAGSSDYIVIPYRDRVSGIRMNLLFQWIYLASGGIADSTQSWPIAFPTAVITSWASSFVAGLVVCNTTSVTTTTVSTSRRAYIAGATNDTSPAHIFGIGF